ncbi:hypothetical protein [Chitinophaga sp. Ak27]|uniref:hypothetical protein n=1 Tax=Chitinophaga sp. Ak27 TaxID=2726116 RepID=UPI00145E9BA4|nr:hypothetical protein [Chitinophaga sp. Ak27]NLU92312.1 hypothetical protein [Chitinophaga sp. Ak27]
MYCIKKFVTCWAIYNCTNGANRLLTSHEQEPVAQEFPELACQQVSTVYFAAVKCIQIMP